MTQNPFWIETTARACAPTSCRKTTSRRSTSTRRTSSRSDRYDFCRALARDAGKLAHRAFGTSVDDDEGRHDVVTEMDREVERFIRAAIAQRYPQDAVHRRRGGRRGGRPAVAHRSDRRHRELRARHSALLRVDRLSRARRADARRDLRSAARLAVFGGARRRRVARWRARSRSARSPRCTAATVECGWSTRRRHRTTSTLIARVLEAGGAIAAQARARSGSSTSRRAERRGVLRTAHQRVGLRGRHRARAGGRRLHERFLRGRRLATAIR